MRKMFSRSDTRIKDFFSSKDQAYLISNLFNIKLIPVEKVYDPYIFRELFIINNTISRLSLIKIDSKISIYKNIETKLKAKNKYIIIRFKNFPYNIFIIIPFFYQLILRISSHH